MRNNMEGSAVLVVCFVAPVLAEETFYIIFDNTLKGCTITTDEPTDKTRWNDPSTMPFGVAGGDKCAKEGNANGFRSVKALARFYDVA